MTTTLRPHPRRAGQGPRLEPHEHAAQAAALSFGLFLRFEGRVGDRRWAIHKRGGEVVGTYFHRARRFSIGPRRGTALSGWLPVLMYAAGLTDNPLNVPLSARARP